eukprot:1330405-Rhodomonas_salina.1
MVLPCSMYHERRVLCDLPRCPVLTSRLVLPAMHRRLAEPIRVVPGGERYWPTHSILVARPWPSVPPYEHCT